MLTCGKTSFYKKYKMYNLSVVLFRFDFYDEFTADVD